MQLTTLLILSWSILFAPPAYAQPGSGVDHNLFDAVLKRNVFGDRVNYTGIRNNPGFPRYIQALAHADPSQISDRDERLAFYINAYNALTINAVLANPGIKSVMSVPDFFKKRIHKLGGGLVSLDEIENKIIRPQFGDPRIHAALNCASVSCPPLINSVFRGPTLNKQLDQVFRAFARDDRRNRVDPKTGQIELSKILEWYAVDFTPHGGPAKYLAKFLKAGPRKTALLKAEAIGYRAYDWNLNGM